MFGDLCFHCISDSNHMGTLSMMAQARTQKMYFIRFLRRKRRLVNDCLWMIGLLMATYLSYAIAIVMKMDDVRLTLVIGRKKYGYISICIWVDSPKRNPILSITSINMYIESKVNKLISNLLKNTLLLARDKSIKMAVILSMNPNTPTAHKTIPLIQYRNIETIVLSISENSGQKSSVEIFIFKASETISGSSKNSLMLGYYTNHSKVIRIHSSISIFNMKAFRLRIWWYTIATKIFRIWFLYKCFSLVCAQKYGSICFTFMPWWFYNKWNNVFVILVWKFWCIWRTAIFCDGKANIIHVCIQLI